MAKEYLTDEEWKNQEEMQRANHLKCLILGKGDDGLLSAVSELLGNRLESTAGRNERVVPVSDFIDYLIQTGFAKNPDEAKEKALPMMKERRMCYKVTPNLSYSIRIRKVSDNPNGSEFYKVSRYMG
ncbi:MAG: hypothetical protein ABIH63_02180 [archaeon]